MARWILLVLLAAPLVGTASAQNVMGITFQEDSMVPSRLVGLQEPFDLFIYLQPETATVGGYECSLAVYPVPVIIMQASGPNGWTNFGDASNHLVGFQTPVPVSGDFVVIATVSMMILEFQTYIPVVLEPSDPSSFDPPAPGYADGVNPDNLYPCEPMMGILNPIMATEARSLSDVKSLFR